MPEYIVLEADAPHKIMAEMNKNAQGRELVSFKVVQYGSTSAFYAVMKLKPAGQL
jgi:hypothetical protein